MDAERVPQPAPVLPRAVVVLLGAGAAVVVIAGMRSMTSLIGPAFLALVFTIAAHPVRGWVERRGLPSWAGTVVGVLVVYVTLLILAVAMLVAFSEFAALLPTYQEELTNVLEDIGDLLGTLGIGSAQIDEMQQSFDLGKLVDLVEGVLGGLLGLLSSLFFVVTVVLFMMADGSYLPGRLAGLPAERSGLTAALSQFAVRTRQYLVVSTIFGLIVGVIDTAVLWAIGVPGAVLWGLLSFITNYIPNIGFVIGVIPPALIGLLEGGFSMFLAVIVAYSVINVVIQTIIQPKYVGDSVGLSGTITMLSLVFWAIVLGPIGALMAVPLTLFAKAILVDADARSSWMGPLLAGGAAKPRTPPPTDPAPAA